MILQILGCGTSTGVPVPACTCAICLSTHPRNKRSRSSALLKVREGANILIDTTPDLRAQALQWGIPSLSAVLYTHSHADHILGIEDLRGFNVQRKGPIPCYATRTTLQDMERIFYYIFNPPVHYEGGMLAKLEIHEITDHETLTIEGTTIQCFPLFHGKRIVTGFKFGSMAYATDCNGMPEETKTLLHGIETLVLDGLRYEAHPTHFTIPQAIAMADELGARTTYLTHMTHTVDYQTVSEKLPAHVKLAWDGLEIPC